MPYTDVPVSINESFSVSQPKIKSNFSSINTVISVNHVTFDAPDQGKHKFITMPQQDVAAGAWPPVTNATEMGLYCKTNGTVPALFIRPVSQAVGVVTNDIDFTSATKNAIGQTRLPSGIMFKWGTGTFASGTKSQNQAFAAEFSTACYHVQITATSDVEAGNDPDDGTMFTTTLSAAGFTVSRFGNHYGSSLSYCYLAIGV